MSNEELRFKIAMLKGYLKPAATPETMGAMWFGIPNWPENIADAWELVEEMAASGDGLPALDFKSGIYPDKLGKTGWQFELRLFVKGVYKFHKNELLGVGDTPMLAICEAWLAWKASA